MLKIIFIIIGIVVLGAIFYDFIALFVQYYQTNDHLMWAAENKISYQEQKKLKNMEEWNSKFSDEKYEKKMCYVESIFEKYGALPLDINQKNREKYGQRRTYLYKDIYYRLDHLIFEGDGKPYMIISRTEQAEYANAGLMKGMEAFSFELSEDRLENEVKFAFGIEPYPENYPYY